MYTFSVVPGIDRVKVECLLERRCEHFLAINTEEDYRERMNVAKEFGKDHG